MHLKRSLEQGSGEGFAKRASDKRLIVDQRQRSHVPKVRYLELGSERGEIAPSKTSGLSTHAKGKLTEQNAKGRKRRKLEIRPPKPVRNAILVQTGLNGISQTIYFSNQNTQGTSFESTKVLDDEEYAPLPEIV